jgi:hypothetical protein
MKYIKDYKAIFEKISSNTLENKFFEDWKNYDYKYPKEVLGTKNHFLACIKDYFFEISYFITYTLQFDLSDQTLYQDKSISGLSDDIKKKNFYFGFYPLNTINREPVSIKEDDKNDIKKEFSLVDFIGTWEQIENQKHITLRYVEYIIVINKDKLIEKFIEANNSFYEIIPEEYLSDYIKEKWGHIGNYGFYDSIKENRESEFFDTDEEYDYSVGTECPEFWSPVFTYIADIEDYIENEFNIELPFMTNYIDDLEFKLTIDTCVNEESRVLRKFSKNEIEKIEKEYDSIEIIEQTSIYHHSAAVASYIDSYETVYIIKLDGDKLLNKFIQQDNSFYQYIPEPFMTTNLKEKWGHLGEYGFYDSIKECLLIEDDQLFEIKIYDYIKDAIPFMNIEQIKSFIKRVINKLKDSKKQIVFKIMIPILATMMNYSQINDILVKTGNQHFIELKKELKSFSELIKSVGQRESSERWDIAKGQYLGYFQMGSLALKDIGVNVNKQEFLKNKDLQIKCFKKLLNKNKHYMKDYIEKWSNKKIPNINNTITESGILMGAHLVGARKLQKFFDSNFKYIPKDSNGTPVTEYLDRFSGYDVSKI